MLASATTASLCARTWRNRLIVSPRGRHDAKVLRSGEAGPREWFRAQLRYQGGFPLPVVNKSHFAAEEVTTQ